MKIKHYIITLAALAVAAFTTTLHASGLPAPMPEFLSQEQLVKWNADQIAAAESKKTAAREQAAIQFYTGKPFDSSSGSYLFKYRSYDPEISRWTSADPSGFPDGPNNTVYAPRPTSEIDPMGLRTSLGQPSLPSSTGFSYGDYEFVSNNLYMRSRAQWEYTGWAYTGVEGVGNMGSAVSFGVSATISGNISVSLSGGLKKGFANVGVTFGASGGIGVGGAITEPKPATPGVEWEAKGLIGTGHVNIEAAYFELVDGQYQFAPGYSSYVHSNYSFTNHFKVGLGIEWFE